MAGSQQVGDALLPFVLHGRFPENIDSLPPLSHTDLEPAIQSLERAKGDLEAEIHTINEETRDEVGSWEKNAKALQEDIIRSKGIANEIVRQSEAPDVSGETIEDAEEKTSFLNKELQYSQQLYGVLKGIQHVNQQLNEVEKATNERRMHDSLRLMEKSRTDLAELGIGKSCRVVRLLNIRISELRSNVHGVFAKVWKELVQIDIGAGTLVIHDVLDDSQTTLASAFAGLQSYHEVDEYMEQLWHNIDAAILGPRLDTGRATLPKINVYDDHVRLEGDADPSVRSLLNELGQFFEFLAAKLPSDLLQSLCHFMMGDFTAKLLRGWLDPAVPSSLGSGMAAFESMIQETTILYQLLLKNGFTGLDELRHWVEDAPSIWLEKCRETALDTIRIKLAKGIGASKQVEKVEKQMVSLQEGKELASTGAGANADTNEWGDAWGEEWDDDNDAQKDDATKVATTKGSSKGPGDDGEDAWGWDHEDGTKNDNEPNKMDDHDDDSAAAWGWGDEDTAHEEIPLPTPKKTAKSSPQPVSQETRELVMKETYNISSMPEPVLELIFRILEDGARLTSESNDYGHVASTAPGLFSLPTFVLALFRAVSPHYYASNEGGNMFLYNDGMYMSGRLSTFVSDWKAREDLTPRAKAMLRLDNDIKSLQNFANRSYANEMSIQKTVLQDFLGGAQSPKEIDEWGAIVQAGTSRIRVMAMTWESILARSVWTQAVGSLVDALAQKLITDVLEMTSISQDDAYGIAQEIASASELDDLFLPSKLSGSSPHEGEIARTPQYAPNWLRLNFLSEFLQSNLNEVKWLWAESELSLYFSADEVVDLIRASFERNERTRETIKEIKGRPKPRE